MAARQTLPQDLLVRKSGLECTPKQDSPISTDSTPLRRNRGVLTLCGYGISVRVQRGHLVVEDGIGSDRYRLRFSRIGHGLERLVVIGTDGIVSLGALRWLADQSASFVMVERDGTVTTVTGPVRPSDSRLRRAQALANNTGAAFQISRDLIDRKLAGQQKVVRDLLNDDATSEHIRRIRSELAEAENHDDVRSVEARAAKVYWKSWRSVPIAFPTKDLPRVPEHWRSFGSRASVLSGSPRLAVNPVNAVLNYLYALLESECRLAITALGLDPGLGVLHFDTPNRDSLACDLMEAIRPDVDAYVLGWIGERPLNRNWFLEQRNGNCRLMADLAKQLAHTAPIWAKLVAPVAERVANEFAATTKTRKSLPTRLTRNNKRSVPVRISADFVASARKPNNVCGECGHSISKEHGKCRYCHRSDSSGHLKRIARDGRIVSHTHMAEEKRSSTQRANSAKIAEWSASQQPLWLTEGFYRETILPGLARIGYRVIANHLVVSRGYAVEIQRGRMPHPRHWLALAELAGIRKSEFGSRVVSRREPPE